MPGPYFIIPGRNANFTFDGEEYHLPAGQKFEIPFTNACDARDFVVAVNAATDLPLTDATTDAWKKLQGECESGGAPTNDVTLPPTPLTTPDPSAPTSANPRPDAPPPADGDNSRTLGAPPTPEKSDSIEMSKRVAAQSDGRPLAQQYYDARDPMPDYDVVSNLAAQGLSSDRVEDALRNIIYNNPTRGLPHWDFGLDNREPLDTVSDPVLIFTGQYTLTVTDVLLPSRGFPLQLRRLYRSGPVYFGPWGYNWDHNYNVYLRELNDGGVAIWTGNLSEDVYKFTQSGDFEPPVGIFCKLDRQLSTSLHPDRYILTNKEGMKQIFQCPSGWPRSDYIPLVRMEDRHGNDHTLSYNSEARLDRIEDHAGRFIRFKYRDNGLIHQVIDHTGRTWTYSYDPEIEHLVAVTVPGTIEYPNNLTTRYEYESHQQHPALLHNLTTLIDPAGRALVDNRYGDDPDSDDFCRVVYQQTGNYEATFHCTRLQYVPRTATVINVPVLRVDVVDPGILRVYTFNYRGDLLDERFRLVRDESCRLVAQVYRYDEQGNLIERRQPNGLGMIADFDRLNKDPRARGNLLRLSLSAPPTKPAAVREIIRYSYEPRYQRIKAARDEGGAVTTFIYDYEVTTSSCGDIIRIDHPSVTLPDGSLQESSEYLKYNSFGQIVERQSAEGHIFNYQYYTSGPSSGYLRRTTAGVGSENQSQEFGYDQYGNLGTVTDAAGAVTEYQYNALRQIVRMRKPAVGGKHGEVKYHYGHDGRLNKQDIPRGDYQDGVIMDSYIRHEFEFNELGYLRSAVYGANTAHARRWLVERTADGLPESVVDPLGRITRMEYDERGLLLHQTHFYGTQQERSVRFDYDRNGNLIRITDPAGRQMNYQYDSWDRLHEIHLPGVTGFRTCVRYVHGTRDQLNRVEAIGVPTAGMPPILLAELGYQFDQRGRLVSQEQSGLHTSFWYDRDSCLVRTVDHRGNETSFVCDALGRTRQIRDALGNTVAYIYDTRGNLVGVDESEIIPNLPMSPELYHTAMRYDSRSRLTQIIDPLGNVLTAEYDDRDLLNVALSPVGIRSEYAHDLEGQLLLARGYVGQPPVPVEHAWERDPVGRVITYTDPEGKQTRYEYNMENCWAKIIYPDGVLRQRVFDAAGQLIQEISPGDTVTKYSYGADGLVERMSFVTVPQVINLADLEFRRDGLGRPVQLSQGGVTVDLQYDLMDRLVSETMFGATTRWVFDDLSGWADLMYPDGRVDRYQLDVLGRTGSITLRQIATSPLTGSDLLPGSLLARYEYIGPRRLYRRVLGNNSETLFSYDQGRRLSEIKHRTPGGTVIATAQYVYDAAGRRIVLRSEPSPATSQLLKHDTMSRLTNVKDGIVAPLPASRLNQIQADSYVAALGSPTAQRTYDFTFDRSDSRTKSVFMEPAGTTTDDLSLNDLHQITRITRTTPVSVFTRPVVHDRDGRRTSDHRFNYQYDALGRLRKVLDLSGASVLLSQDYDPLGRIIRRVTSGAAEQMRYIGARSIQDESPGGTTLRQRCLGMHIDEIVVQSEGTDWWGHQDARLSLMAVSDSTGTPMERYSYAPFGMPTIWAADGTTCRASSITGMGPIFGGHHSVGIVGLYDSRARTYDSDLGCFLQRDPRGYGDSANLYAYVSNNPVDLVDPTGEILPIIAAIVIIGAVGGAGYSTYDAYHHPERYEGFFSWRALLNVFGGAAVAGVSAVAGEALLASAGMGSLAGGASAATGGTLLGTGTAAGGTLTIAQTTVLGGTVSATSGLVWRSGFHGLFPEYIEPPTGGTVAYDYALGGGLGLGFRAVEAVGNPFSRSGRNTIHVNVAEAYARARMWGNRAVGNAERADQIGRDIAELRVGRLHSGELVGVGQPLESIVYRVPGQGRWVVFDPEIDVVTDSAWIQVKASAVPGRAAGFGLAQAEYTAAGSPTGRSIFYVERPSRNVVRDLLAAGVTEVRPLIPPLRGTEPFPLPFGGTLGVPATRLPWFVLTSHSSPPAGGASTSK